MNVVLSAVYASFIHPHLLKKYLDVNTDNSNNSTIFIY